MDIAVNLQPYPAYKSSGVDWLGDVPEHWNVLPNRSIFVEVIEKNYPDEQMLSVTITRGVIQQQELLKDESKKDSSKLDKSGYKLVLPGDIAYNKMRAWQGAIGISEFRGIVSPAYIVQRPRKGLEHRFLHYLLRTPMFAKEAERWSYGIASDMWSLRPQHFKMIYACVPPLAEQRAIVRYLDHVHRRIQRYIETKEKLIALLQEARQSIIQRAVTRGLDPDVPLKPSGVDWLGDVPAHWEVRRLKTLCSMKSGDGISVTSIESTGEYPVYGGNGLRGYTSDYNHDGAFVLIGRQGALCGNVHIAQGKFWATEHAVVATHDTGHNVVWFGAILAAMNLNQYSIAAAQPGLAIERILNLHLPVPSVQEQKQIADHLGKATADIDAAIDTARRQVEFMQEYHTSFIAHVVTGKLDVRAAAAQLSAGNPAEPPVPEQEKIA